MPEIRVLHVSDLHARSSWQEDQQEIVRAMLVDVTSLATDKAFDFVVVSGDLAFSGQPDEYTLVRSTLLEPLMASLGLDRSRVVLVPGNHDVDRARIDPILEKGLAAYLEDRETVNSLLESHERLRSARARLENWETFVSAFYGDAKPQEVDPLASVWSSRVREAHVGIVGLNTAWRCAGAKDKGHLLIGDRQISRALAAVASEDVRLVVMHHPIEWLAPFDSDAARVLLEQRMTIVFHGHEHVPEVMGVTSSRGQAAYLRAGCLYETHSFRNAYNVVRIEPQSGKVTVDVRAWYDSRRAFDAAVDIAEGGQVIITLSADRLLPVPAPSYTPVLQSLGDLAQEVSVVADRLPDRGQASIEDLLVARKYWPVPYQEIAAARELDDEAGPTAVDAVRATFTSRVVMLVGDAEAGVTSSLIWLLTQHFKRDDQRLPVYLRYERGFSKAQRFERGVRRAAARLGVPLERADDLPPCVVAVDDVEVGHLASLDGFVRCVAEQTDQHFILGCRERDDAILTARLAARGVEVERLYLGPFGRAELRELIDKLLGVTPPDLLEKVLGVVLSQNLPRSPFVLAALVAVLSRESDLSSLNISGLLEGYAKWLLGGEEPADHEGLGMDYRRREHLLGWFAMQIVQSGKRRLPRTEAELRVLEYFRAQGWASSSARVLDSLIQRRVLVEDADGVGFRHPALLDLFGGRAMIDDQAFAEQMLQDCVANRRLVEHAAGLRRSDRQLLSAVDGVVARLLESLGDDVRAEMFDRVEALPGWSKDQPDFEHLKSTLETLPGEGETLDDDQLDLIYDQVEAHPVSEPDAPAATAALARLPAATTLLGQVLRNSELVDDLPLKVAVLKNVLRGWGLTTIVTAFQEDQTESLRSRLHDQMVAAEADAETLDRYERLVELLLVFMLVLGASGQLGSRHLELAITAALDDEEFMATSIHALFATLVYAHLDLAGWPARLTELYRRHGRHPLVAELARTYALIAYRRRRARGTDERQLESFLVDVHEGAPSGSGGTAVVRRGATRSALIAQLRMSRDLAERCRASAARSLSEDEGEQGAGDPSSGH